MNPLVIYGAWALSQVVAESAVLNGREVAGFVDPDPPENRETLTAFPQTGQAIVAIGDNTLRSLVQSRLEQAGREIVSIFHPTASVSPSAEIGPGCFLGEYVSIRTNAVLGRGCVLNAGAVASHDSRFGDFVTLGPNAATASHVSIGDRSLCGVGSSIRPRCKIEDDCIIGAGSAVVSNVASNTMVVGVPAREKQRSERRQKQSDWKSNQVW